MGAPHRTSFFAYVRVLVVRVGRLLKFVDDIHPIVDKFDLLRPKDSVSHRRWLRHGLVIVRHSRSVGAKRALLD